jgi:exonuclease SbcD
MLEDEHGVVNIYLLPFIKPAMVRPYFEEQIDSYDEAVRKVISAENIDTDQRNVLVAHQFVVKGSQLPEQSESEYPSVGGLDYVDASAFKNFDYVALGHLHRSQSVDSGRGYYAGSPLKYSVSEAVNHKSVLIIELAGKESEIIKRRVKLTPKRDVLKIKGYIDDVLNAAREQGQVSQDFVHVTLTDDDDIFDPLGQLRQVYPNLIGIDFENSRTELQSSSSQIAAAKELETLTPLDLFVAFYQLQNNKEMNSEQLELMKELFDEARGASV